MALLKSTHGLEDKVLHCPTCLKELEHSEAHGEYTLNDDDGVCDGPMTNVTCSGCEFTISVNMEFYGVY